MKDKLYHFIAGIIIAAVVAGIAYFNGFTQPEAYGLVAAILAGAVKETFDACKAKSLVVWDMFDFLATCLGGFIVTIAVGNIL